MKVLLACDGSVHSRLAEEVFLRTPFAKTAEVAVVAVAPPVPVQSSEWDVSALEGVQQVVDEVRQRCEANVAEAKKRLQGRVGSLQGEVHVGEPSAVLLDFVTAWGADWVVAGSRGESAIAGFLLGSTARRLLSYSGATVLVGRCDAGKTPQETIDRLADVNKLAVLVAYDGSPGSDQVVAAVSAPNKPYREVVVACAEPLAVMPFGMSPVGWPDTVVSLDRERALALVASAAERCRDLADTVTTEVRLGRAANVLNGAATTHHIDLIALGATCHGFIERFLLGSVSYEVATTAPCSVLVVRSMG